MLRQIGSMHESQEGLLGKRMPSLAPSFGKVEVGGLSSPIFASTSISSPSLASTSLPSPSLASTIADAVALRLQDQLKHIEKQVDVLTEQGRWPASPHARRSDTLASMATKDNFERMLTVAETPHSSWFERNSLPPEAFDEICGRSVDPSSRFWEDQWAPGCLDGCQEPIRTGMLADLEASPHFANLSMFVIICNTVLTVFAVNYSAHNLSLTLPPIWQTLDLLFVVFYILEVAINLLVHRLYFFINADWAWNIFDFIVMFLAVADSVLVRLSLADPLNVGFLRVLRMMRVSKILRIFRALRFLSEFRLMANCVLGSMISLVWSCLFLLLTLMVSALVFVQSITTFRIEHPDHNDSHLLDWFGSVPSAMLVLFMGTTGGMDWGDVYDVVKTTSPFNGIFYLSQIVFFVFAFFNIITSMFVDKAMKLAKPDEEVMMFERRQEERAAAADLRRLIMEDLDIDKDGVISLEELETLAEDDRVRHKFEMQGLEVKDAEVFFHTLTSLEKTKELSIDDFVTGCMKMKGPASSLDVHALDSKIQVMSETLATIAADLQKHRRRRESPIRVVRPASAT